MATTNSSPQSIHNDMLNLGSKFISGTPGGKNAVYMRDGHYVVAHPSGQGFVDVGDGSVKTMPNNSGTLVIPKKTQMPLDPMKQVGYNGQLAPITENFSKGGMKLPKYSNGDVYGPETNPNEFTPMQPIQYATTNSNQLVTPYGQDKSLMGTQGIQGDPYNTMSNGMPKPSETTPQGSAPNWSNMATQAALSLMQNAGNIYDLKRGNKSEVTHYDRAQASLMDPSADLQYNKTVFRNALGDVKNASGGNAATYLNNRKDLAINQELTNSRISQQYANQNAQIKNQNSQFNTNVGMNEVNANDQNRAASRNLQGNAINNIGQNAYGQVNGSMRDQKANQRDQQMLAIIAQKYPQAMNDPAFKALFSTYSK
jgi:hypothetical protein